MMMAIQNSVLVIYFIDIQFSELSIGFLNALKHVVGIGMGFIFGWLLLKVGSKRIFLVGVMGSALSLMLMPFFTAFWSVTVVMFILVTSAGITGILYKTIVGEYTNVETRGLSFSMVGIAWSIALLIIPITFGLIADVFGVRYTFFIGGGVMLCIGFMTPLLFKWLLASVEEVGQETSV